MYEMGAAAMSRALMLGSVGLLACCIQASAQEREATHSYPQSPNMSFFVTSRGSGRGGDLGGLTGADQICQELATVAGAGSKKWRAYLSTDAYAPDGPIAARDRIGHGPWQNFKGDVIARNVDDLHNANNKINTQTGLTELGAIIPPRGNTPLYHDMMTGATPEGGVFPSNLSMTCRNWTSSTTGSAMVGHVDRLGRTDTDQARSWNSSHQTSACSLEALHAAGGNGLFYCFAE